MIHPKGSQASIDVRSEVENIDNRIVETYVETWKTAAKLNKRDNMFEEVK